jgi:hypothetical protein
MACKGARDGLINLMPPIFWERQGYAKHFDIDVVLLDK